ncbi:MAG: glycosyltransferase [Cyanobacteria bacterium HKST-UBA01]|nr:glycosyltransferase [Cyanobacteria bacterium HKST-UBA01]
MITEMKTMESPIESRVKKNQIGAVSIILPVYNQADHIDRIVSEYKEVLDRLPIPYELILVTNACKDNSKKVCNELAERNKNIVWQNIDQGGWGRAVKQGLKAATGELICYTNSARTSPEILSLTLLYAISYPNVVVKANRKIRDNWRRRLGSLLYNLEARALFDLPVWDINGTPKIFPRKFDKLLNLKRDDDIIDAEFNMICRQENYPIVEVPVLSTKRHSGKSTTNYNSAFKMYFGVYDLWRQSKQK